ncbi:MAG TPA: hypothetical protein VEL79_17620 [Vicinamibacterales bacterium]|nr:hypothetical protein [Vicinamibacterales bacterium]
MWSFEFRERTRPTLIHGTNGGDVVSHGRIWMEAATARVVKTELIGEGSDVRLSMTTEYRYDPALNLCVPVRMSERYTYPGPRRS